MADPIECLAIKASLYFLPLRGTQRLAKCAKWTNSSKTSNEAHFLRHIMNLPMGPVETMDFRRRSTSLGRFSRDMVYQRKLRSSVWIYHEQFSLNGMATTLELRVMLLWFCQITCFMLRCHRSKVGNTSKHRLNFEEFWKLEVSWKKDGTIALPRAGLWMNFSLESPPSNMLERPSTKRLER